MNTLLMDPVKLAPEVLSALRPLKGEYKNLCFSFGQNFKINFTFQALKQFNIIKT